MKKLSENQQKVIRYMKAGYGLRLHLLTQAYQPNLFKGDEKIHTSMRTVSSLLDRQIITHAKSNNPAHHCYKLTKLGNTLLPNQELFLNYPIIDGHRKHYLHHPVQKNNGKWVAADVMPDGYLPVENNPVKGEFDKEADCQKACDVHNKYHGWNKETANKMVSASMENCRIEYEK